MRRVVAGVGFRRGTGADEIAGLIERALELAGVPAALLAAVATASERADEPAIREVARRYGLILEPIDGGRLRACDGAVATRSARIEALHGVGSLAEAAALAAAGRDGRLVLPRIASSGATCALAEMDAAGA